MLSTLMSLYMASMPCVFFVGSELVCSFVLHGRAVTHAAAGKGSVKAGCLSGQGWEAVGPQAAPQPAPPPPMLCCLLCPLVCYAAPA